MSDTKTARNCLKCKHFFVTWDPVFPRGCHVFNIKTANMPSADVYNATKVACPSFEEKSGLK